MKRTHTRYHLCQPPPPFSVRYCPFIIFIGLLLRLIDLGPFGRGKGTGRVPIEGDINFREIRVEEWFFFGFVRPVNGIWFIIEKSISARLKKFSETLCIRVRVYESVEGSHTFFIINSTQPNLT